MVNDYGYRRPSSGHGRQVRRAPLTRTTGLLKGCVVETEVGPGGAARTGATHSVTWKSRE